MAIYILGPDQNGACCDCATRMNVCDTCTGVCPPTDRMLLPLGTEFTNIWYADLAAAETVLSGGWVEECNPESCVEQIVIGCIGYTSYTATNPDSTTSRAFSIAGTSNLNISLARDYPHFANTNRMNASANMVAGSILSVAWTMANTFPGTDSDHFTIQVTITESNGAYSETKSFASPPGTSPRNGSGTLVFSPLPTTARYLLSFSESPAESADGSSIVCTFNATSDGAMTVNPITALYHTGAETPSCLNCT